MAYSLWELRPLSERSRGLQDIGVTMLHAGIVLSPLGFVGLLFDAGVPIFGLSFLCYLIAFILITPGD